jgi:hypothetical protein
VRLSVDEDSGSEAREISSGITSLYLCTASREMTTCWISIGVVLEFSRTPTHSPSLYKA